MQSGMAISSSEEALANRIDGKRQRSKQESALLGWLEAKGAVPISTTAVSADPLPRSQGWIDVGKATTLRKALLAEGLDVLPDPLRPKVVRVVRAKGPQG